MISRTLHLGGSAATLSKSCAFYFRRSSCQMGTISFDKFGSPASVLKYDSAKSDSTPPGEGQVKVAVKSSLVTYEDLRTINGLSLANRSVGVAGTNAVGSVSAVGAGVSGVSVGDSVVIAASGVWSDTATVASASVAKIPSSAKLSATEAAVLPAAVSAWAILRTAKVQAGDVVVQTNGGSAIGQAVSEVGKALGATVHTVTEADENKAPSGAKAVVTTATGRTQVNLLKHAGKHGTLVFYNGAITPVLAAEGLGISVTSAVFEDKSVVGFDLNTWASSHPEEFAEGVAVTAEYLATKKINIKPSLFAQADYGKAVALVGSSGAAAVLN